MRMPKETLRELLEYHYDRRDRVYRFLAAIPAEALSRGMNTGWSSIHGTLLHCLEVEASWVGHVARGLERPDWDFSRYPDLAAIQTLASQMRQETERYFAQLTEADLERTLQRTYSSGQKISFTLAKLFVHVITHDTHHRGQVLTLARQLGYEPPEIDLM